MFPLPDLACTASAFKIISVLKGELFSLLCTCSQTNANPCPVLVHVSLISPQEATCNAGLLG